MADTPPKSAIEIAMERLQRQDAEAGVESTSLTDSQKAAIADARRICEAQVAECRILHESAMSSALEPDKQTELEANYRRDLARFTSDRDHKIEKIRTEKSINH